jgi:hypothetical protein
MKTDYEVKISLFSLLLPVLNKGPAAAMVGQAMAGKEEDRNSLRPLPLPRHCQNLNDVPPVPAGKGYTEKIFFKAAKRIISVDDESQLHRVRHFPVDMMSPLFSL